MKFWQPIEVIGPEECPIMERRTIIDAGFFKLLHHVFPPGADDGDPHDHPRSFLTFVYSGYYIDVTPCPVCDGDGFRLPDDSPCNPCMRTGEVREYVLAPAFRFRRAEHKHITRSPEGAKSFVVMGRERREWGFWREGVFWPFRKYLNTFGQAHRCP